jgi:zinc-ribbon domain
VYCKACGKQIPDDSAFCSKCGSPQGQGNTRSASGDEHVLYRQVLDGVTTTITPTTIIQESGKNNKNRKVVALRDVQTIQANAFLFSKEVKIFGYGGETFIPCKSKQDAEMVAEIIRDAMAAL